MMTIQQPDPTPQQALADIQRALLEAQAKGLEVFISELYGAERKTMAVMLRGVDFVEGRLVVADERIS